MFKVNNENTKTTDVVLVFLLLTLNIYHTFFQCFFDDFEQINVSWVVFNGLEQIFLANRLPEVIKIILAYYRGNLLLFLLLRELPQLPSSFEFSCCLIRTDFWYYLHKGGTQIGREKQIRKKSERSKEKSSPQMKNCWCFANK